MHTKSNHFSKLNEQAGLLFNYGLTMDYTQRISQTCKDCNYIQNKPINENIKELLIEQLKKKKNKQNKLMNQKKLMHKKTK